MDIDMSTERSTLRVSQILYCESSLYRIPKNRPAHTTLQLNHACSLLSTVGMRSIVDKLIEQEMKKTPRRDRSTLPTTVDLFKDDPILSAEWTRTQHKLPAPPLDNERYHLNPPKEEERGEAEAWKRAVDNSAAHLEAQTLRLVNLELLQKFGANAWRLHNYQLEQQLKRIQAEVEERRQRIVEVNRERKLEQVSVVPSLIYPGWCDSTGSRSPLDGADQRDASGRGGVCVA
ncbi:breast carcinoma amplified sequence 2-domain-containing protein [Jimgerdemannia flammicorona]|uniref:Breast carcinoma amplified sequence 2-domain-containing protein n=1 Tax=Jimgerdemannia flammicorona TaxID=994334 RepID=A0A433QLF8_9FUNG|nr:breast carcinoma amplified sequence 2-domain-containing protein [Jimgerdemannia flammicorona]